MSVMSGLQTFWEQLKASASNWSRHQPRGAFQRHGQSLMTAAFASTFRAMPCPEGETP